MHIYTYTYTHAYKQTEGHTDREINVFVYVSANVINVFKAVTPLAPWLTHGTELRLLFNLASRQLTCALADVICEGFMNLHWWKWESEDVLTNVPLSWVYNVRLFYF